MYHGVPLKCLDFGDIMDLTAIIFKFEFSCLKLTAACGVCGCASLAWVTILFDTDRSTDEDA